MLRTGLLGILAFAFAFPGVADAQDPPAAPAPEEDNLISVLEESGEFDTFLNAIEQAGLRDALAIDGPFTLLVPTDDAFEQLPEGTMEEMLQDLESLHAFLAYHIVPQPLTSAELSGMEQAETAYGLPVRVQADQTGIQIEGHAVVQPDVEAANGVIHVLDGVLLPEV